MRQTGIIHFFFFLGIMYLGIMLPYSTERDVNIALFHIVNGDQELWNSRNNKTTPYNTTEVLMLDILYVDNDLKG